MKLLFVLLCTLSIDWTFGEDLPSEEVEVESRRSSKYYQSPSYYGQNNVFQRLKSQDSYKGYNDHGYETPLCKTPPPCLDPKTLPSNVNRTFLSFPRVLYATMSSCWGYVQLANVHLGRQVENEEELEGMCPTQFWNGTGYLDGYGSQFRKRCIANTDGGYVCVNVAGSGSGPEVDISIQSILSSYLVKSDQKTYALFYRCVDNKYADYVSLSSRPWMEKPQAHQVLGQVLALGFPESEVRFLPCRPSSYKQIVDVKQPVLVSPAVPTAIYSRHHHQGHQHQHQHHQPQQPQHQIPLTYGYGNEAKGFIEGSLDCDFIALE